MKIGNPNGRAQLQRGSGATGVADQALQTPAGPGAIPPFAAAPWVRVPSHRENHDESSKPLSEIQNLFFRLPTNWTVQGRCDSQPAGPGCICSRPGSRPGPVAQRAAAPASPSPEPRELTLRQRRHFGNAEQRPTPRGHDCALVRAHHPSSFLRKPSLNPSPRCDEDPSRFLHVLYVYSGITRHVTSTSYLKYSNFDIYYFWGRSWTSINRVPSL